ncbi:MAG: sigma-54-dependent Fis family transcriptional regulator [Candidatus Brocadia sp. AMX2]|uniref:Response regulatory protein n=1 Tax=Candidatus Brocadia sinica JPN1 TaxID=1197129 RepID=A0ABQ0K0K9_9BACT|nr:MULTISPECIES: sigma-54 dependent transcriptional regulator [Brocadia]MBC6933630.1 sigma-54-dependent Fis family transcriptional regulator [Candidatus Brocadia sp.]MBL1170057.1 sigma-54-dependent Fis family transcriptional regulator [Candidatus Brocadia sp. AMX1]MCK6469790.1 sigma-54 dependent transcriptional regulator [Candidatus Brocadia sinica]NOG42414.1 sigma-54-dependent Fis family transcriptional regulator [Planctomycetota bacterium]KAA0243353.1 MAG: sigma-54-dependent Fis family trans
MTNHTVILVIDDKEEHAIATAEALQKVGYKCLVATSGREGLKAIETGGVDIVVTDLVMHGIDGLQILKTTKERLPEAEVILITGYGTVETAVDAMQKGAATYLLKPININHLRAEVGKLVEKQGLVRSNRELHKQLDERFGLSGIIGNSPKMQKVLNIVKQISATTATVLITGESGTGKELIAKTIHNNSSRKNHPMVVLNSAAIPENLLESELFGHEKGAFTGALYQRKGKFECAHQSTLFLDEIGDMPLSTQVKLLRVIEDGVITRIGSNESIGVDVRLIAATNQDLEKLIKEGKFREDLYFRLNVVSIKLPPLRERLEDTTLLIDAFLRDYSQMHNKKILYLSPEARKILYKYSWPGNVRELKNCIESMVVVSTKDILGVEDIPDHILQRSNEVSHSPTLVAGMTVEEAERELIKNTLVTVGGNREEAAKLLGIGERTLYRKLDRYGLK